MIHFISKYVFCHKTKIICLIILSLIGFILGVIQPYLSGNFIDLLISKPDMKIIIQFSILLMSIGLSSIVVSYISKTFIIKFQTQISFDVNIHLVQHMQKVPLLKLLKYNPAYLNSRINSDSNELVAFFLSNFITIFTQAGTIVFSVVVLFHANCFIFFISLIFVPLYIVLYLLLRKPIFYKNLKFKEGQNIFFNSLNEQFDMINNIKTDASFEKSDRQMQNSFKNLLSLLVDFSHISYIFSSLDGIISLLFQSITFLVGAKEVIYGNMTVGQFTIINSYFASLINGIKYYLDFGGSYQEVKASYTRIKELEDIPEETNGTEQLSAIKNITMKNITFTYSKDVQNSLIDDLSFDFNRNKIYIFCGHNGSGKTTFLSILLGIINENFEGNILYNGKNISGIDMYSTRKELIAVVPQNPMFPSETVWEALNDVLPIDSENALENALEQYNLGYMYINSTFDIRTYLPKRVNDLSGGEKQKIALLKAMLKRPDVLVLDEPSSALDNDSANILKGIILSYKNGHMVFLVTHDDRFNDIADKIIQFGI